MSRRPGWLSLALLTACAVPPAARPAHDPATSRAEMMAADRAFDSLVAAAGVHGADAWGRFFGDSGKQVTAAGPYHAGAAGTAAAMQPFFGDSTNRLRWAPEYAEVSDDGTLGFTIGAYRAFVVRGGREQVVGTGRYLTVWRRQGDGRWTVAADIGNEAKSPPP